MEQLVDAFLRKFYYLRLSITDVCNFRCTYCLPDGYRPDGHKSFLSLPEIRRISRAFAELGTEKIRLTGGEPSMRRDFSEIIAAIHENPQIKKNCGYHQWLSDGAGCNAMESSRVNGNQCQC